MRQPVRMRIAAAVAIGSVTLAASASGCTNVSTGPAEPAATSAADRTESLARALQVVLEGEYRASYSYGIVGALVASTSDRNTATSALQTHNRARDRLRTELTALGRKPEPPPAAYTLPFPVRTPAEARTLAANVETALATEWDQLAAELTGLAGDRARKASADCRTRAAYWSTGSRKPSASAG